MVTPHSRIHAFAHSRIRALFPPLIAPGKREEGAEAEHEAFPTVRGFPKHRNIPPDNPVAHEVAFVKLDKKFL
jgi:hypothetical protein